MGDIVELAGFMTAQEAAGFLGVRARYLYSIKRYLPPTYVGRALLYRREDVERYGANHPNLGKNVSAV